MRQNFPVTAFSRRIKNRFSAYLGSQFSQNADRLWRRPKGVFDIVHYAELDAVLSTARYYQRKALNAAVYADNLDLLAAGIRKVPDGLRDGLYLEFGVFSGRTINHIASLIGGGIVTGFDTFTGLPESWRTGFPQGSFGVDGLPVVASNVKLIQGLFAETLPAFLAEASDRPIAFLHIDCDLYSSTVDVLRHCGPLLQPGSIVCFDEYWNYPGWRQHEFKAWKEFCVANHVVYDYVGFVPTHQQVLVRIESI